jgi:hypothetical protein
MLERYKGDDGDPWHNNPIYMTGPAVLSWSVQKYFKLPYPVSGFLGKVYHVSTSPPLPPLHIIPAKVPRRCLVCNSYFQRYISSIGRKVLFLNTGELR